MEFLTKIAKNKIYKTLVINIKKHIRKHFKEINYQIIKGHFKSKLLKIILII